MKFSAAFVALGYVTLWHSCSATTDCTGPSCPDSNDVISTQLEQMAAELTGMKTGQANLSRQLEALYAHVTKLVTATTTQVSATNTRLDDLSKRVDAIDKCSSKDTVTLNSNVNNLLSSVGALATDAASLKAGQGVLKNDVAQLTVKVVDSYNKQKTTLASQSALLTKVNKCACKHAQVFFVGGYRFNNVDQAKAACLGQGADIAHPIHLDEAWKMGYDSCAWGYLSDGSVRLPMHFSPGAGCAGITPGVKTCKGCKLAGVYCVRYHMQDRA